MKNLIFYFCLVILFMSCSLFDTSHTIIIELPKPPEFLLESFSPAYRLVYYSHGTRMEHIIPPGGKNFALQVENYKNTPFLAYPINPDTGEELLPAGGVYCGETGDAEVNLSWQGGFAAWCVNRCFELSGGAIRLDTTQLIEAVKKKTTTSPWELDGRMIIETLLNDSFKNSSVQKLATDSIQIPETEGFWYLDDLNYPLLEDTNGSLVIDEIPAGFHRIYQLEGEERIDIFVGREGEKLYIR